MTLDGLNVKVLNLTHLRREILGYVNQEHVLFNHSIRENMLLAKPAATDQEIIEALKAANAWDFVI